MRIGLQTWGSDGDIRPFFALAAGLRSAGHEVELAVTSVDGKEYGALASRLGIPLHQTPMHDHALPTIQAFGREILRTTNAAAHVAAIAKHLLEPTDRVVEAAAKGLCERSEIVVGQSIIHALRAFAEQLGRRYVSVQFQGGGIPTRHAPPQGAPDLGPLNPLLWTIGNALVGRVLLPRANALRARLGLPPHTSFFRDGSGSAELDLVAASPSLVTPWPDWPARHVVCGAFELDAGAPEPLPAALEAFLNAGPPPVYVTLGSMIGVEGDDDRVTRLLFDAVKAVGCRAILQSTPAALARLPDDPRVFKVGPSPHAAIFPRCAAVVHHGGAGTTHAACRAGVPSVVVAYYLDQDTFAARLESLGVAPKPLRRASIDVKQLSRRITQVLADDGMRRRARALGERMAGENGVARAVACITGNAVAVRPAG